MGTVWSSYIQTTEELYASRDLRFNEWNEPLWLQAIGVRDGDEVLEVGCAGGAFCHKLKQALPGIRITGLDMDSGHIAFAKAKTAGLGLDCRFIEGDATKLPFAEGTFDLCYSHTVSEHVPQAPFFGEQYRVLKPGGRISVLSVRSRLGIKDETWSRAGEEEKALFEKAWKNACDFDAAHHVGAFEMDEHDYPKELEKAGFHAVDVDVFTVVDYAPDNASVSDKTAVKQIENHRLGVLSSVRKALNITPDALTSSEAARLLDLINERFDKRLSQYRAGEKQWDFSTCTVLAARGIK